MSFDRLRLSALHEGQEGEGVASQRKRQSSERLQAIYTAEAQQPWAIIALLIVTWLVVLGLSLGIKVASTCGSISYWILTFLFLPTMYVFSGVMALKLYRDQVEKDELGYIQAFGDIHWSKKSVMVIPTAFLLSGLLSSLLGIGGGMVIGPLLLEFGVHPVVSAGTTACMTLFTASSAATQYVVQDSTSLDYFFWYMGLAVVAGVIGRSLVQGFLDRTGKQSVVVALLATLISIASVIMAYVVVSRIIDNVSRNVPFAMNDLCNA